MRLLAFVFTCVFAVFSLTQASACSGPPPLVDDALRYMKVSKDVFNAFPTGYLQKAGPSGSTIKRLRVAGKLASLGCACSGESSLGGMASCLQDNLDAQTLCELYEASGAPDFRNPFAVAAVAFPPIGVPLAAVYSAATYDPDSSMCNPPKGGQGITLYCCHHAGLIDGACWGSPDPTAINCTGGPQYAPGGAVGVAIDGMCEHVAECSLPNDPTTGPGSALGQTGALSYFFEGGKNAFYAGAYGGTPSGARGSACSADFGMLIGCRGFLEIVNQAQPFYAAEQDGKSKVDNFHREAGFIAAQRVLYGIPSGVARLLYVESQEWTDSQRAAHLGSVDAEAVLSGHLSNCGMEILKGALRDDWMLMAVPAPGEPPDNRFAGQDTWRDGCVAGQPPTRLSGRVMRTGNRVSVNVSVDDPEASHPGGQEVPLAIAWTADAVELFTFYHGQSNVYEYTFSGPVPARVEIGYLNGAGLGIETSLRIP